MEATKPVMYVPQVLLACGESILVADSDTVHVAAGGNGGVTRLAVAPNGQFVAAFTEYGRLVVWLSDFTKNLSEFSTESEAPPDSLAWCGTDSVVMAWPVHPPSPPFPPLSLQGRSPSKMSRVVAKILWSWPVLCLLFPSAFFFYATTPPL